MKSCTFMILLSLTVLSCRTVDTTLLSPLGNIRNLRPSDVMIDGVIDTLKEIKNFTAFGNTWLIAADDKIIVYDRKQGAVQKVFQYSLQSIGYLLTGQDKNVGLDGVEFVFNKARDRVLVKSTNNLLFLLDVPTCKIEWLVKASQIVETAAFSADEMNIGIGTRYHSTPRTTYHSREYYSTIFAISAANGQYRTSYDDNASVLKFLYLPDNDRMLVLYDWDNRDTFLWKISDTSKPALKYNEGDYLYDGLLVSDTTFMVVSTDHISLWPIDRPSRIRTVRVPGCGNIVRKAESNQFMYLRADTIYCFDADLRIVDTYRLGAKYQNLQTTSNPQVLVFESVTRWKEGMSRPVYYFYDCHKRTIVDSVDVSILNRILVPNSSSN